MAKEYWFGLSEVKRHYKILMDCMDDVQNGDSSNILIIILWLYEFSIENYMLPYCKKNGGISYCNKDSDYYTVEDMLYSVKVQASKSSYVTIRKIYAYSVLLKTIRNHIAHFNINSMEEMIISFAATATITLDILVRSMNLNPKLSLSDNKSFINSFKRMVFRCLLDYLDDESKDVFRRE